MRNYKEHLIPQGESIKEALVKLDKLASDAILFVVDQHEKLIGSLTDGDVRRGLLKNLGTENIVDEFIQAYPKFIRKDDYKIEDIKSLRERKFKILPVLDSSGTIVNIINFRFQESYLPVDAVIMAGGRGSRLSPLTDTTPKPLLKVGDKAIIDYNVDRLKKFGVDDLWVTVKYLGEQLENHFNKRTNNNIKISYVRESEPLGTIGAISKIDDFKHDYVLVTNSDILTDLNYEDFFLDFIDKNADFSVATIPYEVKVPYAVLETNGHLICDFKEKPTYTYYANGGIYLIKKSVLDFIPQEEFFNATDLMEVLIKNNKRVTSFPIRGYWLDIGKHEDFARAHEDIKHIKF
jgi:dTDP-glucose pyrophosphorylase